MKPTHYFRLQPSEAALFRGAAQIYSAYITAEVVMPGHEVEYVKRSVTEAVAMARHIESLVESDDEMKDEKN